MSDTRDGQSASLNGDDLARARRRGAAYHEAGHVLVAHACGWPIVEARLGRAEDGWVGSTAVEGPAPDRTEREARQEWAVFLLAPRAAVELGCPGQRFPAINDEDEELMARLVLDVSGEQGARLAFWEQAQGAAFALVTMNLAVVDRLAAALLEREQLTGQDVYEIIVAEQPRLDA